MGATKPRGNTSIFRANLPTLFTSTILDSRHARFSAITPARCANSNTSRDSHRTNLLRKLGLHDRVELARFAIRESLVAP